MGRTQKTKDFGRLGEGQLQFITKAAAASPLAHHLENIELQIITLIRCP